MRMGRDAACRAYSHDVSWSPDCPVFLPARERRETDAPLCVLTLLEIFLRWAVCFWTAAGRWRRFNGIDPGRQEGGAEITMNHSSKAL